MSALPDRLVAALSDRYRLERELGQGGMATVYLADDLKHDRKVAIKVLRPELAAVLGAERFVQEIKTTASLSHPNILPLFDSGNADGFLYYVMPYVEGETLRAKLDREKQFGVEEAVRITREVAGALDYAHRHGVIHRDIKPENILLHDGRPMVADFGIALAVSAAAGGRMTETGLSLGTPHYMSPEQATAEKEITARSDVYSLGCVLYEMLTGNPPHVGSSAQQIIMKIVTEEAAPVTKMRKAVPPNVAAAVAQALEKLPADRFDSARTFVEALEDPAFTAVASSPAAKSVHGSGRAWPTVALTAAVALAAGFAAWGWLRTPRHEDRLTRLTIPVPGGHQMVFGQDPVMAIAPDGDAVVYYSDGALHRRALDRFEDDVIPGTEGATTPFFSSDGRWIGFSVFLGTRGGLKKVPVAGGPVSDLSAGGGSFLGADWRAGVAVAFVPALGSSGIWMMDEDGTGARQLSVVQDSALETAHAWPQLLPDDRSVLFTVLGPSGGWEDASLVVMDIASGRRRVTIPRATYGRYVATGHILYVQADGTIMAVPFDLRRLSVRGPPVAVLSGVRVARWGGAASFSVSTAGTLAYVQGTTEYRRLEWRDRAGRVARVLGPPVNGGYVRLAPTGDRIALTIRQPNHNDIWLADVASGQRERFSFGNAEDESPVWSPDGRRIAWSSAWTGQARRVYVRSVDRSGEPALLFTGDNHLHLTDWSPDGDWLAYYEFHPTRGTDVWLVSTDGGERVLAVDTSAGNQANATFSPDGRWLAYMSDESGRREVYVVSVPGWRSRSQVSADGGSDPRWTGGELVYMQGSAVTAVPVDTRGRALTHGSPRTLFSFGDGERPDFDVTRDGQHFAVMAPEDSTASHEIRIVLHWFSELARVGQNR